MGFNRNNLTGTLTIDNSTCSSITISDSNATTLMSVSGTGMISLEDLYIFKKSTEYKEMDRQMKLYELSLSAVEEENKKLKEEMEEIKKLILNK